MIKTYEKDGIEPCPSKRGYCTGCYYLVKDKEGYFDEAMCEYYKVPVDYFDSFLAMCKGFATDKCIEEKQEDYENERIKKKQAPVTELRTGWVIYEEVGMAVTNPGTCYEVTGPQELLDAIDEAIKNGEI